MRLERLKNIPEENIKKWNNVTKYCYSIGCNCSKCKYYPIEFKPICQVKLHVLLLYRKFGNPNK